MAQYYPQSKQIDPNKGDLLGEIDLDNDMVISVYRENGNLRYGALDVICPAIHNISTISSIIQVIKREVDDIL